MRNQKNIDKQTLVKHVKDIRLILLNKGKGDYDAYRRYYTNSENYNCCIN